MGRKSRPARLAEFKVLVDFARASLKFLETQRTPAMNEALAEGTSHAGRILMMGEQMLSDGAVSSEMMTGFRQAAADILEMTRDFREEALDVANKFFVATGALSLTEMRRRVWRLIPKVLTRGRIRNIDEFYAVKDALSDPGLSDKERGTLNEMLFDFEIGPPHGPSSTSRRRNRRSRPAPSRPKRNTSKRAGR